MIETNRLVLRPPLREDFDATAAMFAERDVVAHIGGRPLGRPEAWAKLLRDAGHWTIERFGLFSVIDKQSGMYAGKVGHARFERPLGTRAGTDIEMSWTFRSRFHGLGYASEAAQAAVEWFDRNSPQRTACLIAPANLPSLRLASRLGYVEIDRLRREHDEIAVLARDGPQTRADAIDRGRE